MRRVIAIGVAAVALGGFAATAGAAPNSGQSDPVSVCHLTGSSHNPYVLIKPSRRGADKGHAAEKKGDAGTTRAATPAVRAQSSVECTLDGGGGGGGGGGTF